MRVKGVAKIFLLVLMVTAGLSFVPSSLQAANAAGRECSSPCCTRCGDDTQMECKDCHFFVQWLIFKECTYIDTYCGACGRMC